MTSFQVEQAQRLNASGQTVRVGSKRVYRVQEWKRDARLAEHGDRAKITSGFEKRTHHEKMSTIARFVRLLVIS